VAETPLKRVLAAPWGSPAMRSAAARVSWPLAVVLVVVLGGFLRFHGLDWDQPAGASQPLQMQPDERFISMVSDRLEWPSSLGQYFDTAHSPLNPYNAPDTPSYVYGTFPLFLAKGVASLPGHSLLCDGDGYDSTIVCGRKLTASFDTATILLVFALGAVLFRRKIGLAAALLYALAVLPTQLAHFWAMDPYVVFFGTATMLLAVLAVRADKGTRRDSTLTTLLFVAMGLTVGLGLASKVSAWPLALGPVLAVAIRAGLRDLPRLGLQWRGQRPAVGGHWTSDLSLLCLSLALALVVFRVAQPYAFSGPHFWDMGVNQQWRDDIQRESDFQQGNVDYPPFVVWAGRSPYLWPLRNMVLWGLGPALGVAVWVSLAVAAVLVFKRRELSFVLPLVMVVAVIAFQKVAFGVVPVPGSRLVAYMRYFVPAYPALCLFAAWGAVTLVERARGASARSPVGAGGGGMARLVRRLRPSPRALRYGACAAVLLVFAATAWWAAAFQSVYSVENPRIAASRWIYENVPPGSRITGEIWDDTIPMAIPGYDAGQYKLVETTPYDTDSLAKVQALVYGQGGSPAKSGLNGADYVAITSNRIRDSVGRLEREYPATIRYYELLDSGALGFQLVARFTVRPTFLGLAIDDSSAEESFTVYDHPEVRIYKKTADFDAARAVELLDEAHPERAVNLLPKQGRTNGLQFTAAEAEVQQSGGTFTDVFDAHGLTSHLPWLWWVLWLELAAFATLPWLSWLFRALPDRGYGLSKLAGLTAVALPTWMLVAWGGPHFSGNLVWGVFAGVLASGYAIGYFRRRQLAADFHSRWHSWLAMEAAFLAVFFAFLAIRAFNPDLWYHPQGGEKPIDLAYLTAVARSTTLPPYDPWFAGGTMNYYYMGYFFLAVPIRALRILPEVAFNLGIPTFAAMAGTVAFSTVHNLVGLTAGRSRPGDGTKRRSWRRPAIAAGVAAVVLLVGIGNLDGAHQAIERLQALNVAGQAAAGPTYHWTLFQDVPVLGGAVGLMSGLYRWLFDGATMAPFDWWRSSRVHIGQIDITEFPFWTFLFGDLHAHLMGLPFFGLVIALVLAYIATVRAGLKNQAWVIAGVAGLALGLVRTVNTWDFPTAVLLVAAGVAAGQLLARGRWQQRWWDAVGHLVLAAGILLVAFSPYTAHFEVFDTGLVRARETTKPYQYFAQFGLFVAFTVAFLAVRYHEELAARGRSPGRNPVLAAIAGPWELGAMSLFVVGLAAFTWSYGLTTAALTVVALIFLLNLLWLEWRSPERDVARIVATALFAAGVGVAGGVDVVQARNDIVRMNTVFKFGLQAWQLYALASAYAAWYVSQALWRAEGWRVSMRPGRRLAAGGATAVLLVLVAGSLIYVYSGTRARQEARFADLSPTLNGFAYFSYGTFQEDKGTPAEGDDQLVVLADDKPLIDWLRQNVRGSPVIVEAVGPLYHWTGRISWNTGLPTVIGWDWHETQYRTDYDGLVQQRRAETARFFTDPSAAAAADFLRKYNVKYVVVGTEEWVFGTPAGLDKFEHMQGLTPMFRSGRYVIYAVDLG